MVALYSLFSFPFTSPICHPTFVSLQLQPSSPSNLHYSLLIIIQPPPLGDHHSKVKRFSFFTKFDLGGDIVVYL